MTISGRIARQILLLSLLLMIVPAVLFPERLGSGLGGSSLLNIAYEHWINRAKNEQNVLIVETDKINVLTDKKELKNILDTIREYCPA